MTKIGIIGGTASISTAEYYSMICRLSESYHRRQGVTGVIPTPEMAIESLDLRTALSYLGESEMRRLGRVSTRITVTLCCDCEMPARRSLSLPAIRLIIALKP